MTLSNLKNEQGVALLTAYILAVAVTGLTAGAYGVSLAESRHVEREVQRIRSFAAAEAALQTALAQIGNQGYTGFINTNEVSIENFTDVYGETVGSFGATLSYPDQADWVVVRANGTINGETRFLEARVFLESNFSKYLVYANTSSFGSGNNATYGNHDGENPNGVPANEDDRAAMYFTGGWSASGSNVTMYGDVNTEDYVSGNSSTKVYGDIYSSDFSQSGTGAVTNDGITGSVTVDDGFSDDSDRDGDGDIDSYDYPDVHDLTSTGAGDSHKTEELVQISHDFYNQNNHTPQFVGNSAQDRYFELVANEADGHTQLVEYTNGNYTSEVATHDLPSSAIVYVKGDIYLKGEIEGRVSFVSSDDIVMTGDVTYAGGAHYADAGHSTAFLAKDKIYFAENEQEASGILYAETSSGSSKSLDAYYKLQSDGTGLTTGYSGKEYLRLYGNRIMNGGTNLSYYDDRVYGYDKNLRYYRPPGIPVTPDLRTVRETHDPGGV